MLEINNLTTHYGNIRILDDLSLKVGKGEIVSLVGPNGAGKTTLLKAISGLVKATSGTISYKGNLLNQIPTEKMLSLGIAHVPEGRHVFPDLKVEENLLMGAFLQKDKKNTKRNMDKIYELFPKLYERKKQAAGSLSGGEQQMLAMGRALMGEPELLLLDEPSMGLAPIIVDKIFEIIDQINKSGTSILLIEQNANIAFQYSTHAYVIDTGKIVLNGLTKELQQDDNVRKAYLGMEF